MDETKQLTPPKGAVKGRKRVGRGNASGSGCTAGRGNNGAQSRSGYSRVTGFEGGQMPLVRRVPKFGFKNKPFKKEYSVINVDDVAAIGKDSVTVEDLKAAGLVSGKKVMVKLLGMGEISSAVSVTVNAASKSAVEKIEKAGGKVEIVERKKWVREKSKKAEA